MPIPSTTTIVITAQCGSFAELSTQIDEHGRREEVEHPVREDGADERREDPLAPRHPPREHGDAAELADPPRQHGVREQPDAERREDEPEPGPRRRDRLADHRVPGRGADDDRAAG